MFCYTSGASTFPYHSSFVPGATHGNPDVTFMPTMDAACVTGLNATCGPFVGRSIARSRPAFGAGYGGFGGYGQGFGFGGDGSTPHTSTMPWQQASGLGMPGYQHEIADLRYGFSPDARCFASCPQTWGAAWNTIPQSHINSAFNWGRPAHQVIPPVGPQPFAQQPIFSGEINSGNNSFFAPTLGWSPQQSYSMPLVQNGQSVISNVPQLPQGQVPVWNETTHGYGQSLALPGRLPAINIWEEDATLCVEAEVPGVSLDDVDLQIAGRTLYIRTGRLLTSSQSDQQRRLLHAERVPGGFCRAINLPVEIDGEKVETKINNGVLRLTLPKLHAQQRRTIRVNQVATA
jgi:HSP20 family protein